ncbi:restriction endonuclease [Halapricum hydrolyticum]|uniref:Restriction endonuclease n=1 Tax=Halapricum hydrolyticum TaxID=2979991 RepID=A0AAE3IC24_9EURY|nr:restriction endonuclease [Halapricum hydrolyticum]MCU4718852.1 restriction endonuclease [Halapricum hydrolyticum]MCU4727870.1 restriction endonuclease [Halapricum hydrolyticum]
MAEIIELEGGEHPGSNERVDERLGPQYLAEGPLSSYLGEREEVAFVMHAKRGGVTVERDGVSETYKPARGCRTVVAITDLRVVIAIGGADEGGDRVVPIPFSTVTRVATDRGLLRERLVVRTEAGEQWSMPAGGDLDPVVAYLEEAREAWSQADRSAARIEEQLTTARAHLEDDPDAAREAAEEAVSMIAAGREGVRAFDLGDRVLVHAGFDEYRADVRSIQRRALAALAEAHAGRADRHEAAGRLRAACEAHEDARDTAEQALAIDAEQPPDEQLEAQIGTAERERARLEGLPRERATATLEDARSIDDPERRAERLADALAAHRDWIGLSWGPSAPFAGDPDSIRARILDVVDEIVDARTAVIDRLLAAAERLHAGGRTEQALSACSQADDHLQQALTVVTELAPDREETLRTWRVEIDHRRALIEREAVGVDDGNDPDSGSSGHDGPGEGPPESTDASASTDNGGVVAGVTTKTADRTTPERESRHDDGGFGEAWERLDTAPDRGADRRVSAEADLRAMDDGEFRTFVAACWSELGWETTIFAQSRGQYDVMAIRRQLIDLRVLIWTVHRPDGDLDASTIDRCVTDRDNVDRADAAAVVTTANVPDSVRDRAASHDIKLLDLQNLLDLLEDEGLTDLVLGEDN